MRIHRAFTLVELLVVISIIGVLISLLIPAIAKSRQASLKVKCAANLHQLGIAYSTYSISNKNWLPYNLGYVTNDTMWLNQNAANELFNNYAVPRETWDCPAVKVAPITKQYYPNYPSPGAEYSWTNPYPESYTSSKLVPVSYSVYAGRVAGYGSATVTSMPMKIDERKTMLGGSTPTPWLIDCVFWSPGNIWFPRQSFGDEPMHFFEGVNVLQSDASYRFKRYVYAPPTDPNADPDALKFITFAGSLVGY